MLARFSVVVAAAVALALSPATAASSSPANASFLDEINRVRADHGLVPLRLDVHLGHAADAHTHEMIRTGTFGHGAFAGRMRAFHVSARIVGENLAWGVGLRGSAAELVGAWMDSPGHRANLLRAAYRRIGPSAATTTFGGFAGATVVTADFAG